MPTKDEVVEALRAVEDPELGMDIVDLGLLYDVEVDGPKVKVIHSLTSMGCPAGPMIQENIHDVAAGCRGGRGRVDLGTALDAGTDVRRRQVHPRLRLAPRQRAGLRRVPVESQISETRLSLLDQIRVASDDSERSKREGLDVGAGHDEGRRLV